MTISLLAATLVRGRAEQPGFIYGGALANAAAGLAT